MTAARWSDSYSDDGRLRSRAKYLAITASPSRVVDDVDSVGRDTPERNIAYTVLQTHSENLLARRQSFYSKQEVVGPRKVVSIQKAVHGTKKKFNCAVESLTMILNELQILLYNLKFSAKNQCFNIISDTPHQWLYIMILSYGHDAVELHHYFRRSVLTLLSTYVVLSLLYVVKMLVWSLPFAWLQCSNRLVRWLPMDTSDAVSSQPCSVIV